MIDIVFVNPGDRKAVFQDLGKDLTAIEPPFQIASYASFLRNEGFNVAIIILVSLSLPYLILLNWSILSLSLSSIIFN